MADEYIYCEIIPCGKNNIFQINTLSKHIDNHTYTICNKTIWKEGVIYGEILQEDYDNYIKNPNIYSIDSICSYEPQELWDGDNQIEYFTKDDKPISKSDSIYKKVIEIINNEGFTALEDDYDWSYNENDYSISGNVKLTKL